MCISITAWHNLVLFLGKENYFLSAINPFIIYNLVFFIFWSASYPCHADRARRGGEGQSQAGEEDWIRTDGVRQSSCV
jgi:hypothetical protein